MSRNIFDTSLNTIEIGARKIGGNELFFIIEEGQANLGDYKKALVMIDLASIAGADAIEFQLAKAKDFYVRCDPGFEIYLKREFTDSQLNDLVAYTKSKDLEFIAVPLSSKLVEPLAKAGCSGFNINASDITNPDIIDAVVDSGLAFCLSLPLATENEIDWVINRIAKKSSNRFALLHGQHTMAGGEAGVPIEHTSLGYIRTLKEKYQVPAGFVDHTSQVYMPAIAVAAGADIVTKHLILSRKEKGPDWHVCLEPEEMKNAILTARKIRSSINSKSKILAPGENIDRSIMRRSIVASKKIMRGAVIKREDIEFKRPGTGMDPSKYEDLTGKIALRDIDMDEQIRIADIK